MALKQELSQKLFQKLSPQQIQFIKLLQLNTQDFEEKVGQELLDNPALENLEGVDEAIDYRVNDDRNNDDHKEKTESTTEDSGPEEPTIDNAYDDYGQDINVDELLRASGDDDYGSFRMGEDYSNEEHREMPLAAQSTFHEYLYEQARAIFEDRELELVYHLIGSIEDDGYLRRELRSIVNDLAFNENVMATEAQLERLLIKIQNFDPPGIAARDLQECLLLQLYKKDYGDNPAIDLAEKLLSEQFDAFTKKHYDKIKKSLKINDEQLKAAMGEILKLNPKPGETGSISGKTQYIVPDFTVVNDEGVLKVRLNGRNAPELRLSASYIETLKAYENSPHKEKQLRDAVQYIKQKVDGARWFIDSVKQRQNTLMKTMQAIVQRQHEFFIESGDETKLKPMILKDIATQVELDISTISRVANSKYVETDFGIIPLKFFFSEGLTNDDGEEVSNREIKKILSNAIGQEDKVKPLTDEALMDLLKEKGYNIARRTVAKYREQLGIPVARLRKEL
ncbi:MAG: RNA polymerase factor sigma-54 [Bacteroidetes bacterium]|nr:RNA polymerase factor sigma-54 [Bacteroidota bacterium]MDA1224026.1 RNA polymerase factor sigma-54 [Bacteroidota bacterium]